MSASGCGAEENEERVLKADEFWELAREIDELTSVGINCRETSANRGSELLVACILVQRHDTAILEGVMKFHLCFVSSAILPFLRSLYWHSVILERWFSRVTFFFFFRKHCCVWMFIRIDFLSPCCCEAHSLRPIQTRVVLRWPCIFVAWLKPLHPRHLKSCTFILAIIRISHPAWTPRYARSSLRSRTTARTQRVISTLSRFLAINDLAWM